MAKLFRITISFSDISIAVCSILKETPKIIFTERLSRYKDEPIKKQVKKSHLMKVNSIMLQEVPAVIYCRPADAQEAVKALRMHVARQVDKMESELEAMTKVLDHPDPELPDLHG